MTEHWFESVAEWCAALAILFVLAFGSTVEAARAQSSAWIAIAAFLVVSMLVEITWPRERGPR
jgi:putative effector of murein hydrolase LrgA (UPF0299 family)